MVRIVNMNLDELLSPLLANHWSRPAGLGAILVAGILFCATLIHDIIAWHSDYKLTQQQPTAVDTALKNQTLEKIINLPELHLYGQYGAANQSTIPVTSLQFHLLGIIKKTPDKYSRVIISEAGGPGKVYQIGDTLSSGVKVYAITENSIILENAGRFEKLPLTRSPLPFQGKPKSLLKKE